MLSNSNLAKVARAYSHVQSAYNVNSYIRQV